MNKTFAAGIVLILIGIVMVLTFMPDSSLLPFFTGPGCSQADVLVYDGDYNPITAQATIFARNTGSKALQLEAFLTKQDGTVEKMPDLFPLAAGNQGMFTINDIPEKPKEITMRDEECAVADLWNKF